MTAARPLPFLLALACVSCGAVDRRLTASFLQPTRDIVATPADFGLAFEDVWVDVDPGVRVHGWFLPAADDVRPTVVLLHGSRANVSYYFAYYSFLVAAGFHVFLPDYRGYGRSTGELSFRAIVADLEPLLARVRSRPDVDPLRVGLFGISFGSVLALAAADSSIAAVAVEDCVSPRSSVRRAVGRTNLWAPLQDPFAALVALLGLPRGVEPVQNAAALDAPVLVIQGADDARAFVETSRAVVDATRAPKVVWFVEGAGHAPGPLSYRDGQYQRVVADFFERAFAGQLVGTTVVDEREGARHLTAEASAAVLYDEVMARMEAARATAAYTEVGLFLDGVSGGVWTARLEAELVGVFVEVAEALWRSPNVEERDIGMRLLQRAVRAVPERPRVHWWGAGGGYHVGFRWADAASRAAALLAGA